MSTSYKLKSGLSLNVAYGLLNSNLNGELPTCKLFWIRETNPVDTTDPGKLTCFSARKKYKAKMNWKSPWTDSGFRTTNFIKFTEKNWIGHPHVIDKLGSLHNIKRFEYEKWTKLYVHFIFVALYKVNYKCDTLNLFIIIIIIIIINSFILWFCYIICFLRRKRQFVFTM